MTSGIYLQLTKFILLTNQMTVNLTKENSGAVIFESNTRSIDRSRNSDINDDSGFWSSRNYPFDSGGSNGRGDYGKL